MHQSSINVLGDEDVLEVVEEGPLSQGRAEEEDGQEHGGRLGGHLGGGEGDFLKVPKKIK